MFCSFTLFRSLHTTYHCNQHILRVTHTHIIIRTNRRQTLRSYITCARMLVLRNSHRLCKFPLKLHPYYYFMTFHLFSICQRSSSTVTATNVPTSSPTPSSTLSSLNSPPIYNTCPPGNCQFGPDAFLPVPLLQNIPITNTTFLLRFGLPDPQTPLNLSTCACLLAGVEIDGEMVVRPYTPISTNAQKGTFDLLMRKYPQGKMSSYLSQLSPSKEKSNDDPVLVGFKHIPFNVKIQYPFASSSSSSSGKIPKVIAMICGGTGITPMIQALHALLGDSKSATEQVIMLYGSRNQQEILAREMLDDWSSQSHGKFHVTHVLSHEEGEILLPPEDFDEKASSLGLSSTQRYSCVKKGYIDRALIESVVPPATHGDDILIFVCGPPIMYDVLCGPRDKKEVTGVLGEMGYSHDQVYKF